MENENERRHARNSAMYRTPMRVTRGEAVEQESKLKGLRRLNLEDVDSISGGTWDEMEQYLNELCVKYGLEPGNFATLNDLMTPEEVDHSTDLLLKK